MGTRRVADAGQDLPPGAWSGSPPAPANGGQVGGTAAGSAPSATNQTPENQAVRITCCALIAPAVATAKQIVGAAGDALMQLLELIDDGIFLGRHDVCHGSLLLERATGAYVKAND